MKYVSRVKYMKLEIVHNSKIRFRYLNDRQCKHSF